MVSASRENALPCLPYCRKEENIRMFLIFFDCKSRKWDNGLINLCLERKLLLHMKDGYSLDQRYTISIETRMLLVI